MKSAKSICIISSVFILFAATLNHSYCQDTLPKSRLTLSTNVPQFFTGDFSIYAEYRLSAKRNLGGSAGIILPVQTRTSLKNETFSSNDDEYPFWVYTGYVLRLYEKFYTKKEGSYFSPLLLYKNLHYSHYDFVDRIVHGEDLEHYNRSETTNVISFQLLLGKRKADKTFLRRQVHWLWWTSKIERLLYLQLLRHIRRQRPRCLSLY